MFLKIIVKEDNEMKTKMTRQKLFTKVISTILCFLTVFFCAPEILYVKAAEALLSDSDDVAADYSENGSGAGGQASDFNYTGDAYEVVEKRDITTKHFRLEDGSYVAAQYDYPVHYLNESGEWIDIDNSLEEKNGYYNTSDARIKFKKKIGGNGELFTLHLDNAKITMSLVDANKKTAGVVIGNQSSDDKEETKLGKMMNLENISSSVLYKDILENVDLEYVLYSMNVKENLVVKERSDKGYSYTFEMKLNELSAILSDCGDIHILDESGEIACVIPAPVVYDASGEYAQDGLAQFDLTDLGGGKYELTVTADEDWMNDEDRAYPVTVDPAIDGYTGSMRTTYITSQEPTTEKYDSVLLKAKADSMISYWRATSLPTLPEGAYITNSLLSINLSNNNDSYIGAYLVTSDWSNGLTWESWNNNTGKGKINPALLDYVPMYGNWADLDITNAVRKWYDGILNCGIAIKQLTENSEEACLMGYPSSDKKEKPRFTVNYVDAKGIEDYYSYASQSAGRAGQSYVNLANGLLTVLTPMISTTDFLMPLTVSAVFQSEYIGEAYAYGQSKSGYSTSYMGYGFKLSINETLVKEVYSDVEENTHVQYIFADADGTEHYFYPSVAGENIYYDSDGLRMALDTSEQASLNLFYVDGTVKIFSKFTSSPTGTAGAWYLSEIQDKNGNRIQFEFDSSARPTAIKLKPYNSPEISMLNLVYNNGKLAYIYNPSSRSAVLLKYSSSTSSALLTSGSNYLREILYLRVSDDVDISSALGAFYSNNSSSSTNTINIIDRAIYQYNMAGRLTNLTDGLSGNYLKYTYSSSKISSVKEYASDGTLGQEIRFGYETGYTDVKTSGTDDNYSSSDDNLITRYVFDSMARVKSHYTTNKDNTVIYGAAAGKYEEQENVKNNIKESFSIGGVATTYLYNGDFSELYSAGWDKSSGFINTSQDENAKVYFSSSSGEEYISQKVKLSSGKYTISFDYLLNKHEMCEVKFTAKILQTGAEIASETIPVDYYSTVTPNSACIVFEVPTFASGESADYNVEIKLSFKKSGGTASYGYFDNVVLASGVGTAEHNSIKNGDFDSRELDSSGNAYPLTDTWIGGQVVTTDAPFVKVGKLTSSSVMDKNEMKQVIYEATENELYRYDNHSSSNPFSSNANQTYVVSGFGYGDNAAVGARSEFGIKARIYYYQGDGEEDIIREHLISFEAYTFGWQFTTGSFSAYYSPSDELNDDKDYSCVRKIEIVCVFSGQGAGSYAYFDKISATRSDYVPVDRYEYDDKGNLIEYDNGEYSTYYEYDEYNNVVLVGDDKGNMTFYKYDDNGINILEEIYFTFGWVDTSNGEYNVSVSKDFYLYKEYVSDEENGIEVEFSMELTPLTYTEYTYNQYGLCTKSVSAIAQSNTIIFNRNTTELDAFSPTVNPAIQSGTITVDYTYDVSSTSKVFGATITESTEETGTVRNFYDNRGYVFATVNLEEAVGVGYAYDDLGRVVNAYPVTVVTLIGITTTLKISDKVSYTYDEEGNLGQIATDGTVYTLTYDNFGKSDTVSIGDRSLAEYEYNPNNGKLIKLIYGNGYYERYVYNELEKVSEIWYNIAEQENLGVKYEYTRNGSIYRITDYLNGRITELKYDGRGRAVGYIEYSLDEAERYSESYVSYDDESRVVKDAIYLTYNFGTAQAPETLKASVIREYSYDEDGRLSESSMGGISIDYTYDELDRITEQSFSIYGDVYRTTEYVYEAGSASKIEKYVSTLGEGASAVVSEYTIAYDSRGFITEITQPDGKKISYEYDIIGQLTREVNEPLGKRFDYSYDNSGNITGKITRSLSNGTVLTEESFGYTDTAWGDLRTEYNGYEYYISYDEIGNPTGYYAGKDRYIIDWEGRLPVHMYKEQASISFTYNADGLRTSKTVDGVKHEYELCGEQIISEKWGDKLLLYIYDANGAPIGMRYIDTSVSGSTFETYWFEKNFFGDIIAVYNGDGVKQVSYVYDAWGNQTVTTHVAGSAARYNPFRYRGYYYDADLEFYYLQTRYYDSAVGRFINADTFVSTGQGLTACNMFAYCGNNPVNYVDPTGEFGFLAALGGFLIGSAVQYFSDVVCNIFEGKKGWDILKPSSSVVDYVASGLKGMVAFSGMNVVGAKFVNSAIDGAAYIANCEIEGEDASITGLLSTVAFSFITTKGDGLDISRRISGAKYSKEALKTMVSSRKSGMVQAKYNSIVKDVWKYSRNTFLKGFAKGIADGVNNRFDFIDSIKRGVLK